MSNISNINLFFILVLSSIICAQSQVYRKPEDDNQQQVHAKVERINLRDFGIVSKTDRLKESREIQREDDQKIKEVESRGRDPFSSPRRIGYPSVRRSSERSYDSSRGFNDSSRRNSYEPPRGPYDSSRSPYDSSRGSFDSSFRNRQFSSGRTRDCSSCVDSKYLQHYYAKGCEPVTDPVCKCPISFDCPYTRPKNSSVCLYDGRRYNIGLRIPVKNPCRICECRDFGRRNGEPIAEIDCGIGIECPEEAFGVKPQQDCYFFYEYGKCCGRQECPNKLEAKSKPKVCKYKGIEYKLGQKIYPDEDQCKTCHCTQDWNDDNPLASLACHKYRCEFELSRDFSSGCLPIYHEGTCCPIEYKCPKSYALPSETSSTQCVFEGRKYAIGSKLDSDNVCVDCTCKVPPDFTCVHKSCPSPEPNCYVAKWDNSVCCQKYICSRPRELRDESQFRDSFYSPKNN